MGYRVSGMSHLIARILMAIFLMPLSALVYMVLFVIIENSRRGIYSGDYRTQLMIGFVLSGAATWLFLGGAWFLLWRKSVNWTGARVGWTVGLIAGATLAGVLVALLINGVERTFGDFVGSVTAPLLWLVGTLFVWRESKGERAARLSAAGKEALVCPTCGYNLTGLSELRCPECGSRFTIEQLIAAQPGRVAAELES